MMKRVLTAIVIAALSSCARETPVIMPLPEQETGIQNIQETADDSVLPNEFSGNIYAEDAVACDNQPYVVFRENEYVISCNGDLEFRHICNSACSENLAWYAYSGQTLVGKEEWIDEDTDEIADEWRMWTYWDGASWNESPVSIVDSRIPPSENEQGTYDWFLRRGIGKEEVEIAWEKWKSATF
ncbi:MAG: hypothetical protein KJ955_05810 [Nanoarchaeota archaeon]|nr:hypothetical protein [Nanoarchaeota archaeon]